jgi:PKHD-type hydroxylase
MVRDEGQRTLLFDIDISIQGLRRAVGESPEVVRLTGVYHNLIRRWAEA